MMGRKHVLVLLALVIISVTAIWAQVVEEPPARQLAQPPLDPPAQNTAKKTKDGNVSFYRLDFHIRIMEKEVTVEEQRYRILAQSNTPENMTSGAEVPYRIGPVGGENPVPMAINTRGVGTSIYYKVLPVNDGNEAITLSANINFNGLFNMGSPDNLIAFRSIRVTINTFLVLDKPTTVSVTDDATSDQTFYVDVTATKIKDLTRVDGRLNTGDGESRI